MHPGYNYENFKNTCYAGGSGTYYPANRSRYSGGAAAITELKRVQYKFFTSPGDRAERQQRFHVLQNLLPCSGLAGQQNHYSEWKYP